MATINPNNHILIIGAGHFGQRALNKINESYPLNPITIIDHSASALRSCKGSNNKWRSICADGIQYVLSHSHKLSDQSLWIVPSIPVHLAYEWMMTHFSNVTICNLHLLDRLVNVLPNVMMGKQGTLYMSYATFRCPDNCPEPSDHCFYTQKPRKESLFKELQMLTLDPYTSVVIQSHQLLPGVGGYQLSDLYSALYQIQHADSPILLSTACRCHGVMNGFSLKKQ
jgi:hypothetical protein